MDVIESGTILIDGGATLPKTPSLQSAPYSSGWTVVTSSRSEFEKDINLAGWTFFFLAGAIEATVFGFDKQKAVRTAVDRIITDVKSQDCNCLEITEVKTKSFLGLPFTCVSAHSRHVQGSSVFAR
jgi:hypothetical protein